MILYLTTDRQVDLDALDAAIGMAVTQRGRQIEAHGTITAEALDAALTAVGDAQTPPDAETRLTALEARLDAVEARPRA